MKHLLPILLLAMMLARPIFFVGIMGYYSFNVKEITTKYCVNKNRPQLKCNGKCHIAKQFRLAEQSEKETANKIVVSLTIPLVFFQATEVINFLSSEDSLRILNSDYKNLYSFEYSSFFEVPPRQIIFT